MLRSHFPKLLFATALGALIAFALSLVMPKKYEGFVQILVDQKPMENSIVTDSVNESVKDLVDFGRSRGIATQVDQLTSYGVLIEAAQRVAPRFGINNIAGSELDPQNLMQSVSVSAETVSDLITVQVRMKDPEMARAVAAEIYNAFNEGNIRRGRELGQQAVNSLQDQSTSVQRQLGEIDRQMREIRVQYQAPSLDAQIQADIATLAQLRQSHNNAVAELVGAQENVTSLQAALAAMPRFIQGPQSQTQSSTTNAIEQELAVARSQRASMLVNYHPDSQEVRAIDEKIRRLAAEESRSVQKPATQSTRSPNPERQQMVLQLAGAKARLAALQQTVGTTRSQMQAAQADLAKWPELQARMQELIRRQASLEKLDQQYQDRLQVLSGRETGRVATSAIVAGPAVLPQPVSPKIPINTLLGALLGLALGGLWMMLSEARNQPIRTLGQLNALSFGPVYRLVPELRLPFRGLERQVHDSFERLLVHYRTSDKRPYRVGVIGLVKDSGASTVAANLAVSAYRQGEHVAIVDFDPRTPQNSRFTKHGEGKAVKVIRPEETSAKLNGEALVIYDFDSADRASDYATVAGQLDETILLVRASHVRSVDFLQLQQTLRDAGCPQVTVVFSRATQFNAVTEPLVTTPDVQALHA